VTNGSNPCDNVLVVLARTSRHFCGRNGSFSVDTLGLCDTENLLEASMGDSKLLEYWKPHVGTDETHFFVEVTSRVLSVTVDHRQRLAQVSGRRLSIHPSQGWYQKLQVTSSGEICAGATSCQQSGRGSSSYNKLYIKIVPVIVCSSILVALHNLVSFHSRLTAHKIDTVDTSPYC